MKKKKDKIHAEIEIPEKVEIAIDKGVIHAKGGKGETKKKLIDPNIKIEKKEKTISLESDKFSKPNKKIIGTFKAHIKNMMKGVTEGHIYKLKICNSHFPMNVSINNNQLIVKNFLGEKIPRTLDIKDGAKVNNEGDIITVEGVDKEIVAQTAADIEKLTRITNKDKRIFQDGIYITEKDGKEIR